MAEAKLLSYEFRRQREGAWAELDGLVARAEKQGIGALTAREVVRLPVLYRATLSALSVARAVSLDRNVTDYLESLCARAYIVVYAPKRGFLDTILAFLGGDFPAAVRRLKGPIFVSFFLTLVGFATGFGLTASDPENYYSFVAPEYAGGRDPSATTEFLRKGLYEEEEPDGGSLAVFATFLFTHNAKIGMLAFFLGSALGVPTFLLLFSNGLLLGAFAALYQSRGLSVDLWGWLLPHGIPELTAVVLAGGAGLALAAAIVFPGRRTRLASLAHAGRDAGCVLIGTVLMFLVAGIVEGVFRQTVTDVTVRYAMAGAQALFWFPYFVFAGRRRK